MNDGTKAPRDPYAILMRLQELARCCSEDDEPLSDKDEEVLRDVLQTHSDQDLFNDASVSYSIEIPTKVTLVWHQMADRDLNRFQADEQRRIREAVQRLATTGYGNVAKVKAMQNVLRLRVGDWRVFFTLHLGDLSILRVQPFRMRIGGDYDCVWYQ